MPLAQPKITAPASSGVSSVLIDSRSSLAPPRASGSRQIDRAEDDHDQPEQRAEHDELAHVWPLPLVHPIGNSGHY